MLHSILHCDTLQVLKWKRCKELISGKNKTNGTYSSSWRNDSDILDSYKPSQDCHHVLRTRFVHPPVSVQEQRFPIAFGFAVYKGAPLLERILQAIYMPNNIYCIHIDKKSPDVFRRAIQAMIRCLPNVFIATNSFDVVWGHISIVQAHFSCMEELLESSVKWKYYINLVGQDFPLYENKQIVTALKRLDKLNNIASYPIPEKFEKRIKFVYTLKENKIYKTRATKSAPPHNITIYKGLTFIVAIREFVEFVIRSKIGRDFLEFLKDTQIPDETVYASLQQHPLAPGGIYGKQPKWIPRAFHTQWPFDKNALPDRDCHGVWIRSICWISIEDLRWALGREMRDKLFVHKIPFDFSDDLLECILVAREGRKYGTTVWNQVQTIKQ